MTKARGHNNIRNDLPDDELFDNVRALTVDETNNTNYFSDMSNRDRSVTFAEQLTDMETLDVVFLYFFATTEF